MLDIICDILFPQRCFGCDDYLVPAEEGGVCGRCAATVHPVESPKCPRCALPRELRVGVDDVCRRCLQTPPAFDATHACLLYDGAVRDAIRTAKSADSPSRLVALVPALLGPFFAAAQPLADATWTTVPSHPADLRRRGWDPPRTLLGELTRRSELRLARVELLEKVTRPPKQARLGRDEREKAPCGAYRALTRCPRTVVLFDDVMTTGATLHHASKALRAAGARTVIAVVAARSV